MAPHIFNHVRGWYRICIFLSLLLLPTVLAAPDKSAADYFVKELPGAPDGPLPKMHAGHIEITPESHGNLFFWHFQNRHIGDKQRTVIWLNGGPGCSSLDGALMEVGPFRAAPEGKLEYNNGSWDEFANTMFVDQPVGTGFSYVDTDKYVHELDEMADNFVLFMEKFMTLFPEYVGDDLYFAGESFAGQYIPYIGAAVLKRNRDNPTKPQWNLSGLLIGNGWIAPKEQYEAYLKFTYQKGLLEQGSQSASVVEKQQATCLAKLTADGPNDHVHVDECEAILNEILTQTSDTHLAEDKVCLNMYDVRLRDNAGSCGMNWPPPVASLKDWARKTEVVQALHVDPQKQTAWTECSGAVGSALRARNSKPSVALLPDLLKEIPVVLFSGDQDLICNHVGTEAFIHNMDWNGGKGFELPNAPGTWAPRRDWTFEGEPAGFYQEARNLTYVLFYNASHMVPFDYPRRSRDMLDRFMGVDISGIGGHPSDSRIDGEKGLETSVGGHPNSTAAEEAQRGKLKAAAVNAYYKSGEVVLVILLLGLAAWGVWYWRQKKRRGTLGYSGVAGSGDDDDDDEEGLGMVGGASRYIKRMSHAVLQSPAHGSFRDRSRSPRVLEAADFDESELADLTTPATVSGFRDGAEDEDDDGDGDRRTEKTNGNAH